MTVMKVLYDSDNYVDDSDAAYLDFEEIATKLDEIVQRYEKRYRTQVEYIALAGTVGTWKGNFFGGIAVDGVKDVFRPFNKCDTVRVHLTDDDMIEIHGIHHDGVHRMKIYFITAGKRRALNLPTNSTDWYVEELAKIAKYCSALKADRPFKEYFGLQ